MQFAGFPRHAKVKWFTSRLFETDKFEPLGPFRDLNGSKWIYLIYFPGPCGRFVRYPQMFAVELGMLKNGWLGGWKGGVSWNLPCAELESWISIELWRLQFPHPPQKKQLYFNPSRITPGETLTFVILTRGFLRLRADNSGPKAIGVRIERSEKIAVKTVGRKLSKRSGWKLKWCNCCNW